MYLDALDVCLESLTTVIKSKCLIILFEFTINIAVQYVYSVFKSCLQGLTRCVNIFGKY